MAENKKSFLLYADFIDHFEDLTDEEAGQLIKHIFRYINDQEPEPANRVIQIAFNPIKQSLKRDLKKWEVIKGKKSDAGKASAESKRLAKIEADKLTESTLVETVAESSTHSTVSVSDSVSVSSTMMIEEATVAEIPISVSIHDLNPAIANDTVTEADKKRHENFSEQSKNDTIWKESFFMQDKMDESRLVMALKEYKVHLVTQSKKHLTLKDFKQHFVSWVRWKKEQSQKKQVGKL